MTQVQHGINIAKKQNNPNRFKVDSSGYQPSLNDSSNPAGAWQGSHPPPPSQPYLGGRMPFMPPRELPFPPQHMRQFRPSFPPSTSPEYRIYDLNKRLSMRTEDCDHLWWDLFVNEFFEDDAIITISMYNDDGPKRFYISRALIGRFFRTLFDGGVSEVYFQLKHSKEIFHNPTISLDCEQGSLITCFGKPSFIKVCTEGHLNIEFTFDDLMRIKSLNFSIKQYRELIPRSVVAIPTDNPIYLDQLSRNYTRNGLTNAMINFLRSSEILEPMQEIMSRYKTTSFSPRDCLKTILHQRWSKTCSDTRPVAKTRRKRKNTTTENAPPPPPLPKEPTTPTKKRSSAANIYPPQNTGNLPGDVMIVGEPSLMGGEMDDEDERYITRLENTQYDPNTQLRHIKKEQISFSPSPQQQQQQQLPSMFSTTSINGDKRTSPTNQNSSWNASISEEKQEAHTPPATPQQPIITA